ncbi:MAG: cysteine peptidase family C39 domain-containing protein [Chloroflexi bacterium]|nr:cysteine peptidase family C39 domain-containing protein [Chloroflexota bacterium]
MRNTRTDQRRFFAPEVVQTSAMDCGPAALKCLLEGFGVAVSYGRLREACQTDVDGTSIDRLEDVAQQLGLQAQQVLAPVDHLMLPAAHLLPALVVTVQPSGATHFVVVWRTVGRWIQVMDPATGRRWISQARFAQEIYRHQLWLPADAWRTWAGSAGFCDPLRERLRNLGLTEAAITRWVEAVLADPAWRPLAALDATTRLVTSVMEAKGVTRGIEAAQLMERFFEQARQTPADGLELIPPTFWSVQSLPVDTTDAGPAEALLLLRGAVLLHVSGHQLPRPQLSGDADADGATDNNRIAAPPLAPDLAAALAEPRAARAERPAWAILQALRADGLFTPSILLVAALLAALSVTLESALFRGLMTVNNELGQQPQRTLLAVGVLVFSVVVFFVEVPLATLVQRIGRQLEIRLRIALLEKIPRLGDHYFHSRLISDMAHRAYSLGQLHSLPSLAINLLRQGFQLMFTAAGVIWLAPSSAPLALLVTFFAGGAAFLSQPLLAERDLRVRTHTSALSRFYLDALLGLLPIRAHSAERAVRREHEMLLVEWVRASWGLTQLEMLLQASVALIGIGSVSWIVLSYLINGGAASGVLLLLYWALNLPALGQSLVTSAQQYPMVRNHLLRLLEPLGAPEEEPKRHSDREQAREEASPSVDPTTGVALQMAGVVVHAGGHTVLHELDLNIAAGEHVAIVGPSGAGKSSLVGLLLGWQQPAAGQLLVDGSPLLGEHLQNLRRMTAWVDPAVQLWNRTLAANLRYGLAADETNSLGPVLTQANLAEILEKLPDGWQTSLGEGGGLVSGGEGQRVRLGRALLRPDVRLAILDEPFRGLDRQQRQQLLTTARQHWQTATLLCITHDVAETQDFTRVLVLEDGRIVEDGTPQALAAQPTSRYRALLDADTQIQQDTWAGAEWRQLWLEGGQLREV